MKLRSLFFVLIGYLFAGLVSNCNNSPELKDEVKIPHPKEKSTPVIDYVYVNSYPHDKNSFTEGFLIYNGDLYESTGATKELPQTKSLFGIVDRSTGKIDVKIELDRNQYFGEGITFLNGKVFQLTYQAKIGFIYDAITFKELGKFNLPSQEGWGLTTDGTNLIMSDGTATLYFLEPKTLSVTKTLSVSENGYSKDNLNELEYINGFIYANIWLTNSIVKINPENGEVVAQLDLTSLADEANYDYPNSQEMNGIAFDSISGNIFVTGKMWPKFFEISFSH